MRDRLALDFRGCMEYVYTLTEIVHGRLREDKHYF